MLFIVCWLLLCCLQDDRQKAPDLPVAEEGLQHGLEVLLAHRLLHAERGHAHVRAYVHIFVFSLIDF